MPRSRGGRAGMALAAAAVLLAVAAVVSLADGPPRGASRALPAAKNFTLPALGHPGQRVALAAYAGRPVMVNFFASWCAVADVTAYSRDHGMVNQWDFLTGSPHQLAAVWKAYHMYARIQAGQVDHIPAVYVIDQRGREQKLYLTTMAYASISQQAQILATEVASLLPGHLRLASQRSLSYIRGLAPTSPATLTAVPSGSITLGPGRPHLVLFLPPGCPGPPICGLS